MLGTGLREVWEELREKGNGVESILYVLQASGSRYCGRDDLLIIIQNIRILKIIYSNSLKCERCVMSQS